MKTMSITAFSSSHGQSWPFVTLPDFDLWTNRYSIGAKAITLVVFAKDSQREAWSEYSQAQSESWVVTEDASEQIIPHVWKIKLDELSLNISLPEMSVLNKESIVEDHWESVAAVSWQSTTPFFPNAINFNQLTSPALQPAITLMNATKLPVQWSAWEVPAATFILQPIERNDSSVVAYLMAQFTWLSYFKAEMIFNPLSTPGVILIVQETCAGYVVELDLYVGREPRLLEPEQLTKIVQDSAMVLEAPLDPSAVQHGEGCSSPIMLQLYATEKFAGVNGSIDVHMEPPKLAIATGIFVMLLGSLCFLGYDLVVRRRQAKLAESAKKSLAIVNSLFPANVRDRLMEKEETRNFPTTKSIYRKRSSTGGSRKKTTPQNGRLQSRITTVFQSMAESIAIGNDSITEDVDSESPRQGRNLLNSSLQRRMASKPIADLFPQVTVLFADIAGFTAWSSVREPSQVFTLLESIFEAFDVIAKKHKVFKVETIG